MTDTTRRGFLGALAAIVPGIRCLLGRRPADAVKCTITSDDSESIIVTMDARGTLRAAYRNKPMIRLEDSTAVACGYPAAHFRFVRFVDSIRNLQAFVLVRPTDYGFLHLAHCAIGDKASEAFWNVWGKDFIGRGLLLIPAKDHKVRTSQGRLRRHDHR